MVTIVESAFQVAVKKDIKVLKFLNTLEKGSFNIDTKQFVTELSNLHSTREVRKLNRNNLIGGSQSQLLDANLQNAAFRSRCVEIKVQCFNTCSNLEEYLDSLKRYIFTKYVDYLKQDYTTQADRKEAVNQVLDNGLRRFKNLKKVITIADLVVEDIDKSGWTIKSILEVLELTTRRENVI